MRRFPIIFWLIILAIGFNLALTGLLGNTGRSNAQSQDLISPDKSLVQTFASIAKADGQSEIFIAVTIRDQAGRPISNLPVMLASTRGAQDLIRGLRPQTNQDGRALFAVRSQTPGHAIVRAQIDGQALPRGVAINFVQSQPFTDNTIVQEKGSGFYYQITAGKKHWLPNAAVAQSYNLSLADVPRVDSRRLAEYPRVKLIRLDPAVDDRIYYLTETGLKRHILTVGVFFSYGNQPEDIMIVNETELNSYPDADLIRAEGDNKVYWLANGQKHWIVSPAVFAAHGFDWRRITPVNIYERDRWPEGAVIR